MGKRRQSIYTVDELIMSGNRVTNMKELRNYYLSSGAKLTAETVLGGRIVRKVTKAEYTSTSGYNSGKIAIFDSFSRRTYYFLFSDVIEKPRSVRFVVTYAYGHNGIFTRIPLAACGPLDKMGIIRSLYSDARQIQPANDESKCLGCVSIKDMKTGITEKFSFM